MYKLKDHIDHYDDVFETLPSAIQHMNTLIECDVEEISKSHYSIIDETGEVVSEYISDNYHLFTEDKVVKRFHDLIERGAIIESAIRNREGAMPYWLTDDIRQYAKRLMSIADAMDVIMPARD